MMLFGLTTVWISLYMMHVTSNMMKGATMLPPDLQRLTIFPARLIVAAEERLPDRPGVYLFFIRGGSKLLAATSYFDLGCRRPLSFRRRQHLYTGATFDLRRRLRQHMAIMEASSLRRSLLAVERQHKAISRSATPACSVQGERSLTAWLCENALVGVEVAHDPLSRERELLSMYASPLNVTLRRGEPFARALLEMRREAFRSWDGAHVRRIRSQ
jgi:hypothetical protein